MLCKPHSVLEEDLFSSRFKRSNRLRSCLVLLLLVFALGTLAYAGHHHDEQEQGHHQVCDYCLGFAHLGATPVIAITPVKVVVAEHVFITRQWIAPLQRIQTVAQARAPPV